MDRRIIRTNALGVLLGVVLLPFVILIVYGAIGPFPRQSLGQFVGNLPIAYLLMGFCDLPQGALLGLLLARVPWVWRKHPGSHMLIAGTLVGCAFGAAAAHFDLERLLLIGSSTETSRLVIAFGLTSALIMPLLLMNRHAHSQSTLPHADAQAAS